MEKAQNGSSGQSAVVGQSQTFHRPEASVAQLGCQGVLMLSLGESPASAHQRFPVSGCLHV